MGSWPITRRLRYPTTGWIQTSARVFGRTLENKKTPLSGFYYNTPRQIKAF
jgi:hypothetical protein